MLSAFLSGPGSTTMPLVIFSRARLGLNPSVNAVATAACRRRRPIGVRGAAGCSRAERTARPEGAARCAGLMNGAGDAGLAPIGACAPRSAAYLSLAASMALVGSYVGLSKLLVAVFPVLLLAWLRFGIAAVAMAHWVRRRPGDAPLSRARPPAAVLGELPRQLPVQHLHARTAWR